MTYEQAALYFLAAAILWVVIGKTASLKNPASPAMLRVWEDRF